VTPWAPFCLPRAYTPPWTPCRTKGTKHRWSLDDGVFMGSVAEVEGVLAVMQQALPPLGLEVNMGKTKVWGPGLVPRLHL